MAFGAAHGRERSVKESLETLKVELERFGEETDAAIDERSRRMLNPLARHRQLRPVWEFLAVKSSPRFDDRPAS